MMFHSSQLNERIDRLHKIALRLIYDDEFLQRDRSCTIHKNNSQELATEMFKLKHGLRSEGFESVFIVKNNSTRLRAQNVIFVYQKSRQNILEIVHCNTSVQSSGSLPVETKSIAS